MGELMLDFDPRLRARTRMNPPSDQKKDLFYNAYFFHKK